MSYYLIAIIILVISAAGFTLGRKRSRTIALSYDGRMHSLPAYHGLYIALWCAIPSLLVLFAWTVLEGRIIESIVISDLPHEIRQSDPDRMSLIINDVKNLAGGNIVSREPEQYVLEAAKNLKRLQGISSMALFGAVVSLCIVALVYARSRVSATLMARNKVETTINVILIACSTVAVFTTLGIVLSVLFESIRFFKLYPIEDFLFGTHWSPQTALRADQVGSSGEFGAVPLVAGTFLISLIAMSIAGPIGLMSAIYMSEYASRSIRSAAKPVLEILAGIPTVVYGYFAALTMAPLMRDWGLKAGFEISSESALAAGVVMGIMIIPFVSSLSDDVINAVPQSMRDGSLAMGATQSETIVRVLVPAALPGIVASLLLAVSRAIGETMIVVMAAGLTANLTANPFEAVTTVTVQIVTLLVGDQEFDSAKTLSAFALGLLLFVMTLILNIIALVVVRRYREQYE